MSVLEFDLERQLGFAKEEGKEEGREQGREEGREQGSDLKLISLVCRKLKKGKPVSVIAEELEEEFEIVERICKVAEQFAPEYDVEKIYEELHTRVA